MICYLWWPTLVSDGLLGTESLTVLPTTPVGSAYRSVVGRRMVYVAVTPTAVDTRTGWIFNDIGGDPFGQ